MQSAALRTKDDYLRIAKPLVKHGEDREAFNYVREGLQIRDNKVNYKLSELYFEVIGQFLMEEEKDEGMEEALEAAIDLLLYRFNPETYDLIKKRCSKT